MTGRRTAWLHCFAGVAGDMFLGACIDAGADVDAVRAVLGGLGLAGWSLDTEAVLRGGIASTRAVVRIEGDAASVRDLAGALALLDTATLPEAVRTRSGAVFRALAGAEAEVHGATVDGAHFHEVGALDAVVDVVGTCAALWDLDVGRLVASPVATGVGTAACGHGVLPVPAPAVVALLRDVPVVGRDVGVELTTPTGAALVSTLADGFGPPPPMTVRAWGFGAGSRDPDGLPNVVHLVLGDPAQEDVVAGGGEPLLVLAANLDDATGEVLAHAQARLVEEGALDAWLTPVTMKKGRPGVQVGVLCRLADRARLLDVLAAETGTLGVRAHVVDRWTAARRFDTVDVGGEDVRLKVSSVRTKAEFGDASVAAEALDRPVREVLAEAERAAGRGPGVPGA